MIASLRRTCPAFATVLVLAAVASPLRAQVPNEGTGQSPCSSAEHRLFDFWLGEWDVYVEGEKRGENTIRRAVGGCVVHESYRTADSGYEGQSFNIYDRRRDVWHQTWVDNQGLLLQLDGGFQGGRMRLEGVVRDGDGGESLHRITWNPVEGRPDRVRQHWERSDDGGTSWETVFDGIYRRAGRATP